jgi:tetratricopeptide (TPR) repeat protein
MSSIIEGYNYDIFISYRQKDNKHDGWISEFVSNLKGELESTFKEEISVYFDINTHDGLLETHEVDDSLKEKLNCLIFIPVISRTYCDTRSFAWEHEFMTFAERAKSDRFGLKVRLPNGNVASRILPVRIYDLDIRDIRLCESVLGGPLRGVDFIYSEPGINRPLKPDDDEKINLNRTKYINQINKLANAIREITDGLLCVPPKAVEEEKHSETLRRVSKTEKSDREPYKYHTPAKRIWLAALAFAAILTITAIFLWPDIFMHARQSDVRSSGKTISVAVMPFKNLTNDTVWNVWQEGIQNEIVSSLANRKELRLLPIESINYLMRGKALTGNASFTPAEPGNVSQKLDADIYIPGSIKQAGDIIRINAQIIDPKTNAPLTSFQKNGSAEEILSIIDSLSLEIGNFLIIKELGSELPSFYVDNVSTASPEALRCFIYGRNYFYQNDYPMARKWLEQAISADSNFIRAISMLSTAYSNEFIMQEALHSSVDESLLDQGKKLCLKAYSKRDKLPLEQQLDICSDHAKYFETPYEEIKYLKQLQELDDMNPVVCYNLGGIYSSLYQYDKAIQQLKKALSIYDKWEMKPLWSLAYTLLGDAYHATGRIKDEEKLYARAEKDFPNDPFLAYNQEILAIVKNDTAAINRYSETGLSFMKSVSLPEASIKAITASIYSKAGMMEKAEELYRNALSLDSLNPVRLNDLAYFLIDKNRNVDEGVKLAGEALILKPDYYRYLDTRGWGLYRQGRYRDAVAVLEKSWDLRRQKAVYDHDAFLHLEAARKAVAEMSR